MITQRPLTAADVQRILDEEARLYPLAQPLSVSHVLSWTRHTASLSATFWDDSAAYAGSLVVVGVTESAWTQLLNGQLDEEDIAEQHLYQPQHHHHHRRIGLYLYHIERGDGFPKRQSFAIYALRYHLAPAIEQLRREYGPLEVIGMAALAVSRSGIDMCLNTLDMREVHDRQCEVRYILRPPPTSDQLLVLRRVEAQAQLNMLLRDGYRVVNRCRFVSTSSGNDGMGVVWAEIDASGTQPRRGDIQN
ncbi:hypothetical protein RI367_006183 [Sorochytrium milnesiophthora]